MIDYHNIQIMKSEEGIYSYSYTQHVAIGNGMGKFR